MAEKRYLKIAEKEAARKAGKTHGSATTMADQPSANPRARVLAFFGLFLLFAAITGLSRFQ